MNIVQTQEHVYGVVLVRVGWCDFVHPGCVARIRCRVPADFTSPLALFEVIHTDPRLEQLALDDGLL